MNLKYGILTVILLNACNAVWAQSTLPAYKSRSGTYYFTNTKPITLKWGDTHFFKDTITKKRKNGDTTDNFSISSVTDAKYSTADITVYPNPFVNTLNIKYDKQGDL